MGAELCLSETTAQRDDGGGRILLGDNTGTGEVMLRPIMFQYDGVQIYLRIYMYIYICAVVILHVYKI